MFGVLHCDHQRKGEFIVRTNGPPNGNSGGLQHFACDKCRVKKLRCSGQRTGCNRCQASNSECTYTGGGKQRQKRGPTRSKSLSAPPSPQIDPEPRETPKEHRSASILPTAPIEHPKEHNGPPGSSNQEVEVQHGDPNTMEADFAGPFDLDEDFGDFDMIDKDVLLDDTQPAIDRHEPFTLDPPFDEELGLQHMNALSPFMHPNTSINDLNGHDYAPAQPQRCKGYSTNHITLGLHDHDYSQSIGQRKRQHDASSSQPQRHSMSYSLTNQFDHNSRRENTERDQQQDPCSCSHQPRRSQHGQHTGSSSNRAAGIPEQLSSQNDCSKSIRGSCSCIQQILVLLGELESKSLSHASLIGSDSSGVQDQTTFSDLRLLLLSTHKAGICGIEAMLRCSSCSSRSENIMLLALMCEKLVDVVERAARSDNGSAGFTSSRPSMKRRRAETEGSREGCSIHRPSTLSLTPPPSVCSDSPPTQRIPIALLGTFKLDTAAEWSSVSRLLFSMQLRQLHRIVKRLQDSNLNGGSGAETSSPGTVARAAILRGVEQRLRDIVRY